MSKTQEAFREAQKRAVRELLERMTEEHKRELIEAAQRYVNERRKRDGKV